MESYIPSEPELACPNADFGILVEWRAKRDVLYIVLVAEKPLCRLVKALRDMVQGFGCTIF